MADLWEYGIKDVNDRRVDAFVFSEKVLDLDTNLGKNETIGFLHRVAEMNARLVEQGIKAQDTKNQVDAGHFVDKYDYGEMLEWFQGGWGEKFPKSQCKYIVVRRRVEAWNEVKESAWPKR